MLVTCRQMQEIEASAFAQGVSAAELMEQAGSGIAKVVQQFFPVPGTLILYLGSGNNAGDALVAAHHLQKVGWQILARLSGEPEQMKPLPLKHWQQLGSTIEPLQSPPRTISQQPCVLLDGLLGIGSVGPLRSPLKSLAAEMNALRQEVGAMTIAMDIPSGLDGDTGMAQEDAVIADITTTVAYVKKGLLADEAINHVGRLTLIPLPDLASYADTVSDSAQLLTPAYLSPFLPRRPFDFHKGQAGRVGILAGSPGYFGAAELACRGALRAGAGLVTLIVKAEAYDTLAKRMPPEVMVRSVEDYRDVLDLHWNALAIGPGLGFTHEAEYLEVIQKAHVPVVIDADALTALARQKGSFLANCTAPRLLTPHPGEMDRLRPNTTALPRRKQAENWAAENPAHTLLLKGARTIIATQGHATLFNSTGHPGMATGGMGDVLTGVSAALLGQGIPLPHSAGLATWLCGRAAELHARNQAPESTLPSDVIDLLGKAWQEVAFSSTVY